MNYAYVRVSSITQSTARQLEEISKFEVPKRNIYIDKQSGKDFNRKNYQKLIKKLRKNDLLIIKSIDRLGRNYKDVCDQWKYITKDKKADIYVIDMPMLDTRKSPDNLWGVFVADLVLQLLSFIAENERINIKQRQAEGIKIAKKNGVKFGRPSFSIDQNFIEYFHKFRRKEIKIEEILKVFNISKATFYKYAKSLTE